MVSDRARITARSEQVTKTRRKDGSAVRIDACSKCPREHFPRVLACTPRADAAMATYPRTGGKTYGGK